MKRSILFVYIFGVVTVVNIYAQQVPIYSHYMYNQMALNPAYAGSQDLICMRALNRQQWVGLPGAPVTSIFNVNAPFNLFGASHGAGLNLMSDNLGFDSNLGFKLAYALRINAGSGKLSIGVGAGIINPSFKLDEGGWNQDEIEHGLHQDGSIPTSDNSDILFDLDVGIYYKTEDLFVGFSANRLNSPDIEYDQGETVNATPSLNLNTHFNLITGYNLQLPNPSFVIKPTFIVQTDTKIMSFDINATVEYNKKFWAGVSYRMAQMSPVIGMIGFDLFNGVKVGYAYDLPSKDLRNYTGGSHELMIGYCFSLSVDKTPEKYKSIRYL